MSRYARRVPLRPWVDLFDEWGIADYKVRERTRGRQGVYVFRKRGVVRYVGSSVADGNAAPLRLWKTIMRHFQKCAPVAVGHYAFGEDNFCTSSRTDWQIGLFLYGPDAAPETVRARETELIEAFRPADQAQKKPRKGRRKKRR